MYLHLALKCTAITFFNKQRFNPKLFVKKVGEDSSKLKVRGKDPI